MYLMPYHLPESQNITPANVIQDWSDGALKRGCSGYMDAPGSKLATSGLCKDKMKLNHFSNGFYN